MKNFPLGCTILPAWCQKVSASGWDSTTQLSVMLLPRTARSCWSGTHIIGGTERRARKEKGGWFYCVGL